MKYRLIIRPEAEWDIEEFYNWYEDQAAGLGNEFLFALQARLLTVVESPLSCQIIHLNIRRAVVRRFPHAFFYFVEGEIISVIACVHHKRDPQGWRKRI
ncbi:MAG: type II toxin-antitoxin system RelE/ParE family toxin [Acidobacteria bacterium]|nr:type II toxin-antitoxin system RelE/ParE family toxin [Acidobacteriota bacterium]